MPTAEKEELAEQNIITEVLDMLDRQPFVEQLIRVANMLADNKKNACYAINGGWGVGKTYVLDMFEKQIRDYGQEGTTLGKFLVFHYNCWQYDYYEEPLIAIVSAMIDAIDDEVCLLSIEKKEKIKAALRAIAKDILNDVNRFVIKKTGINIKNLAKEFH
jgi:predicted ATPase